MEVQKEITEKVREISIKVREINVLAKGINGMAFREKKGANILLLNKFSRLLKSIDKEICSRGFVLTAMRPDAGPGFEESLKSQEDEFNEKCSMGSKYVLDRIQGSIEKELREIAVSLDRKGIYDDYSE